jgi:predicted membrane protein
MTISPAPTDPPGHGRVTDLGRLLLGLIVVALGVLYLLDAADVLDAGKAISDWWPLLLVAAGLLTLIERPPSILRGTVLTAAGVVLLLFTTGVLDEDAWAYVWPVAIIVAGLLIMIRWRGHRVPAGARAEDVVRATALFGGPDIASTSQRFEGAWLTAVFGGITLDLRHAKLDPEGATVNATAAFGGIDVLVPHGWRISVRSTPILGGVEDKTDRAQVPAEGAPVLHVDAVAAFGGVTVKHEK